MDSLDFDPHVRVRLIMLGFQKIDDFRFIEVANE